MRLIDTVYDLIMEAAPEQIYQKYYSDIEKETFNRIISVDPATKIAGDQIKKIGKFSKLLISMYKDGNLKPEDYPKATDYLNLVYKHQVPVDMTKIKTLGDLFSLVEKYYSRETGNVFDLINVLGEDEFSLEHNGEEWLIYIPKTEKSAAYLGTGTEWCTAWGPYSTNQNYKDRKNHFASHSGKGPLYVVIKREDPTEKYQFHFETKQFMDKNDRGISLPDFFDREIEVTGYFYPSLYNNEPVSDEETDKMGFLSNRLSATLIEKIVGDNDNPIVDILVNKEGDDMVESLKEYITDGELENLTYEYNRGGGLLEFSFDGDDDDLNQVMETTNYYSYDSDPYADHGERLREDVIESDEEWQDERVEDFIKQLWDSGYVTFTDDYEMFKEMMMGHKEGIINDFADEHAYLHEDSIRNESEVQLNSIHKFIMVDEGYVISIPPSQMALFVHREKLTEISHLESFFSAYVNYHGLVFEYENPMWNMNLDYPTYEDMKTHMEGYCNKIQEEFEETPDCLEKRREFADFRRKFFGGGNRFSKEDIRIELNGNYDCEKGAVPVKINYLEKTNPNVSNWRYWSGDMTMEKIVEYITNERLLEDETL